MARSIRKMLVHAYACDPNEGSEPGAGWRATLAALDSAEQVTIFTRANNVDAVQSQLAELRLSERADVVGFDLRPAFQRIKKHLPGGTQIYYLGWQLAAVPRIRSLHASRHFELAIHSTFAVDWLPTSLQWVRDLPYVWGPVGGASRTPVALYEFLGFRGIAAELIRIVGTGGLRAALGASAARRSTLVLAQNDDVSRRFRRLAHTVLLPNAAPQLPPDLRVQGGIRDEADLVAVGRLLPWKGVALAIHAVARPECSHLTLTIYGEGPDEGRLRRLASGLGVAERVTFRGRRPRHEVLAAVARAKALVYPSFHDSSSWAIAEALALGCPVIALDLGGPSTLLEGAGLEPIPHDDPDLIGRLARSMAHPPPPGASDVWTPEAFGARLGEAIKKTTEGSV